MVNIVLKDLVKKMVMCLSLIIIITNDDDGSKKNSPTNLHDLFETINRCEDKKPIGYSHLHYSLHPS